MRNSLIVGSICLLGLGACKKELPSPVDEDPVFQVGYQLDGQAGTRTAGLGGVYLFTDAAPDADAVWQFSGSFADAACPVADCPGTMTFTWRNYTPEAVFDSTWNTGTYAFYQADGFDSTVYRTTLEYDHGASGPPEVSWILDDLVNLTGTQVVYDAPEFTLDVYHAAQYSNGLSVASRQLFYTAENFFCLQTSMQIERDSAGLLTLTASPQPAGNYQYAWSNGDTASSTQAVWQPGATYSVTVSSVGGGCPATVSLGNLPDNGAVHRSGLVDADAVPVPATPFGGPIIEWIDAQGRRWRSDRGAQPFPANFFELLEVSDYEKNENGLPTKQLRINWKCRLYNDAGESIPMEGSGVVAVGWPG